MERIMLPISLRHAVLLATICLLGIVPADAHMQFRGSTLTLLDFPTLVPGQTYGTAWAATATPAAQGDTTVPGGNEPAIAGWDTPQYLEVSNAVGSSAALATPRQKICVDAFHVTGAGSSGIARVDFQANGGPVASVPTPLVTPEANQLEYCAYLDVSAFNSANGTNSDQTVEVRATVYPVNGTPLVLQGGSPKTVATNSTSWFGYAAPVGGPGQTYYMGVTNASATACGSQATPCTTLAAVMSSAGGGLSTSAKANGANICVNEPGVYDISPPGNIGSADRWFTVRTCGTATPTNAFVKMATGAGGGDLGRWRFYNIGFYNKLPKIYPASGYAKAAVLFDHVNASPDPSLGPFGTAASYNVADSIMLGDNSGSSATQGFIVDSTYTGYQTGPNIFALARGVTINSANNDNFSKTLQVVNNVVHDDTMRAMSGPYAISSITDTTHIIIPKTTALYNGDCVQNPGDKSSSGFPGSCVGGGALLINNVDNTGASTVLTLSGAISGTPTKFMQATTNHVDFWQGVAGGVFDKVIIYGNTDTDRIVGQTVFWDNSSTSNSVVVNNAFNNTNALLSAFPSDQSQQYSINISATITNVLFSGNTHNGGPRGWGLQTPTDWFAINESCPTGGRAGVGPTLLNSPSC